MNTVAQIGLDGHREFSRMTWRDQDRQVLGRGRLNHRDREAMCKQLQQFPPNTPVILEATFGWPWLCDQMQELGLEPHLANSRKLAAWREARGLPKTDRMDADLLSEMWSEPNRWWEVWLPPKEVRIRREWLRYRSGLIGTQTGFKNRIHAVLHRHGILHDYSDLFGVQGRPFLKQLCSAESPLPESARETLAGSLRILESLRREIAKVTWSFRKQQRGCPTSSRLRSLPGISWILAYTIHAEVGEFARFPTAKHLASYSLLAPRANDSGQKGERNQACPRGRHLGKAGRRTLKWAWIEAARSAVCDGGRFADLFKRSTGRGHKKSHAYIIVARELCHLAYLLEKKEMSYQPIPPERPGQTGQNQKTKRRARKRNSRLVKGQPRLAMVAAAE